jgi:transcriptional regulator with XRE-family HTH domain
VILSKSKNNFKEVYIMEVGERIKLRREELNMTQEELAQKVGYTSRSSIAKIESNANGMLQSKLNLFAEALQTTPSYLIGWEEIDEETEKKNDTLADIILKLRIDDELFKMVQALSELSSEQRTAVKSILSAFISTK